MSNIGISLGWNCSSAQDGVRLGLRSTKESGFRTCPFDIMVSNYIGVCKCIEDDFQNFCNTDYLKLRKAPQNSIHIPNQNDNEFWIYNDYYNFAFNHESPHGQLFYTEKWPSPNFFIDNNFENFIKRYNERINNFRYYINSGEHINFIIYRYNSIPYELIEILNTKYPNLNYTINLIINFGPHTKNCLINPTNEGARVYEVDYLKYFNIDPEVYPTEYSRYTSSEIFHNEINIKNLRVIDPTITPELQ